MAQQRVGRTNRPRDEVAAAVGTAAREHVLRTPSAERALERADARLGGIRRQIAVAAFAVRTKFEHVPLPMTLPIAMVTA